MKYFAVERRTVDQTLESPRVIVELVFQEAQRLGLRFQWLEVQGDVTLPSRPFVRFKTDLDAVTLLVKALEKTGRGVIEPTSQGYQVRFSGRKGAIEPSRMHLAPLPGMFQRFRGTAHPLWEQQFVR